MLILYIDSEAKLTSFPAWSSVGNTNVLPNLVLTPFNVLARRPPVILMGGLIASSVNLLVKIRISLLCLLYSVIGSQEC